MGAHRVGSDSHSSGIASSRKPRASTPVKRIPEAKYATVTAHDPITPAIGGA